MSVMRTSPSEHRAASAALDDPLEHERIVFAARWFAQFDDVGHALRLARYVAYGFENVRAGNDRGGFAHAFKLVLNLIGLGVEGWAFYGTIYNEGDGIIMGQEAGAGLQKVGKAASRLIMPAPDRYNGMRIGMESPSVGSGHSIVVNAYGRRYAAENLITDDPSRYFFYKEGVHFDINKLEYPNSPSWMIFDEKLRTSRSIVALNMSTAGYGFVDWGNKDNSDAVRKGWILKADTLEELAEKIRAVKENGGRMDPKTLAETVKRYNEYCAKGVDEDFGRKKKSLQPVDQGPFYAVPLVAGGPNTKGGLACNAKREVLDWNFKPIPRLYAVGEIASALKYVYQGGGNLTECVVFGQVCGKNVAKLKSLA